MEIAELEKELDLSELETGYHRLLRAIFGNKLSPWLRFTTVEELKEAIRGGFLPCPLSDEAKKAIDSVLSVLTEREVDVIKCRFALGGYVRRQTLEEVALAIGLSRESVRQIEHRALMKLRHPAHTDKLKDIPISWEELPDKVSALRAQHSHMESEFADFKRKVEENWEKEQDRLVPEEWKKKHLLLDKSIEDFELSVRTANCLGIAGIMTIRDLVTKTEQEMLRYRNFGRKSLNEIKIILNEMGLSFGMVVPEE